MAAVIEGGHLFKLAIKRANTVDQKYFLAGFHKSGMFALLMGLETMTRRPIMLLNKTPMMGSKEKTSHAINFIQRDYEPWIATDNETGDHEIIAADTKDGLPSDPVVNLFFGAEKGTVYVWEAVSCRPVKDIQNGDDDYELLTKSKFTRYNSVVAK